MRMFADDTKVWAYIRSTEDSQSLQKDLDSLTTWSKEWLLHFNPDKCKVMHIGHKLGTKYYMMDDTRKVELQSVSVEKDLGVFTTDNLKPSLQCQKAAAVKIIPFPRVGSLIAFPCFAYVWLSRFWLGLDLWRYGASL